MKQNDDITINITPRSIALFTLIPLALFFLWFIRDLLFSLLIAFILMSALRPGVTYLVGKKIPHGLAVSFVYLFFILFILSIVSVIIPPIVTETTILLRSLPYILEQTLPHTNDVLNIN